jgi:hypothetical protein
MEVECIADGGRNLLRGLTKAISVGDGRSSKPVAGEVYSHKADFLF